MRKIVVAFAVGCATTTAHAGFYSGNKLLEFAQGYLTPENQKSNIDVTKSTMLLGYVVGVHDAIELMLCVPNGVTAGQLTEIVARSIVNNPNSRHLDGSVLVVKAINEAFPCKSPASSNVEGKKKLAM